MTAPPPADQSTTSLPELLAAARAAMTDSGPRAALPLWQEIRDRYPDDPEGHIGYGAALRDEGRLDEADGVLAEATARFPDYLWAWVNHAWCAMRRPQWDEALRRWRAVCERFADEPVGYVGAGEALRELGRLAEAEAEISLATRRFPDDLWAHIHHAILAERQGDFSEAVRRWQVVRDRFPSAPQAPAGLARALAAAGKSGGRIEPRPNFRRILEATADFRSQLRGMKDALSPDFPWYPYDILANIAHIEPLITEGVDSLFAPPKNFADIGAADGDLSFFLEANGHSCDIYDYGLTNMNGLRGAALLKERRNSKINIVDIDLDSQFLLRDGYDMVFMLGILYHLKNPYYVLETCARSSDYLLLSTRIAKHFSADSPDVSGLPAAYLLDPAESNNDPTNYWIFTDAGLRRLIERAGWTILGYRTVGAPDSNPQDDDKDERAFALLKSTIRRTAGSRPQPKQHNSSVTVEAADTPSSLAIVKESRPESVLAFYQGGEKYLGTALADFFHALPTLPWPGELCRIMTSYGSDKGAGWHNYTLLYDFLFGPRRQEVRAVCEVGIGSNFPDMPSNMGRNGRPGASLRGWRDYFPAAAIVGADIDRRILFSEERIATYYVNQLDPRAIDDFWEAVSRPAFDLIVDDGLHAFEANSLLMQKSLTKVAPGGLYVIEDIAMTDDNLRRFDEFFKGSGASGALVKLPNPQNTYDNCLAIFTSDGQGENRSAFSFGGWNDRDRPMPAVTQGAPPPAAPAPLNPQSVTPLAALEDEAGHEPGAAQAIEAVDCCQPSRSLDGYPPPDDQEQPIPSPADDRERAGSSSRVDLETAGAAAWEASQFEVAAPIFRQLARREPQNLHVAFRLAHSLAAIGEAEESDAIFHRAVASDPDDFWTPMLWALRANDSGNLNSAELVARRLMARFTDPAEPYWRIYFVLGDIAMKRLNPADAVPLFEAACAGDPGNVGLQDLLARARVYDRVTRGWPPPPVSPADAYAAADYHLLYVNMDVSTLRRGRLEKAFVYAPQPRRIAGVIGNQLPRSAFSALWGEASGFGRGTLGCTLSHVAAWEFVVANNLEQCLIVEDDAVPLVRFPLSFATLNIPDDFDICFVQESTEPKIPPDRQEALASFFAVPLATAWSSFPDDFEAPRTTGYFISSKGAKQLLAQFAQDGYGVTVVDWRIVAYSVSSSIELPPNSVAANMIAYVHNAIGRTFEPLITYSLYPSLVKEQAIDWPRLAMDAEDGPRNL